MIHKKYTNRLFAALLIFTCSSSFSMNITRPYNFFARAEHLDDYRMQLFVFGQGSFSCAKGFNDDGCQVNILRIWNDDQNALKMLEGFPVESDIGQTRIRIDANDDGVRGHFLVDGDLSAHGLAFSARWSLPEHLSIVTHVPLYFMRLKNVCWQEQTKDITASDARTKTYLTNDFFKNVFDLGGLDLGSWKRSGIGDVSVLLEWLQDFAQTKPFLKNVRVNARAGIEIPTGKKRDEDKIFALPFGNDGGTGLIFGGGLDVTLGKYLKTGFDVELKHVFGNNRCRRIKTQKEQTELLLLAKTETHKEFGLSQRFSLYGQADNFLGGLACKVGYEFFRHGDDTLALFDHAYSEEIANTSKVLEEWTMHNFFFGFMYDFKDNMQDSSVHPYVSAFVRVPFNGRYSAQVNAFGIVLSLDF
ncbi:hypothetical protein KAH94_04405 [bacterium]|nr:hypothetical protein [bacterium]